MKSPGRQSKDAIYEQFARIGSAVTCPKRLELLDLLCQGPKNGEALARETGMSLANTSQHLQTLRAARLVEADKEGLHVIYRPVDRMVCEFFRSTRVPAENRLAEIESIKRQFSMEGKWKNAKQSSGTESKTDKRIAISGDIPRRPFNSSSNTEVKPSSVDGTAWAAVWESRTPPKFFQNRNRAAVPVFLWRTRIAEFALS